MHTSRAFSIVAKSSLLAVFLAVWASPASAGRSLTELNPIQEWMQIRNDPGVWTILGIFGKTDKWVRNNKRVDGKYVAAPFTAKLVRKGAGFYLWSEEAAEKPSPLLEARTLYFWRRSVLEEQTGPTSADAPDFEVGDVIVAEGEEGWRFVLMSWPNRTWLDVKLVTRGKDRLLYIMVPGTDQYLEEWILR